MILGSVELTTPYAAGAGVLNTTDVDPIVRAMDAYPSRCRVYRRSNLLQYTTYTLYSAGGTRLAIGPALEGTVDQDYAPGDLVWLQCNLMDAVGGGSYLPPAFTAFSIQGQTTAVEVGTTIGGGPVTFDWSTSNSSNVAASSIAITDATTSTVLASGLPNTGSDAITIGSITNTAAAVHTWGISAKNTQGGSFSDSFSVAWEWRVYAGTSGNATLTANQIKALSDSSGLQVAFAGTYNYADVDGFKYFCYPDALGSAVNFIDAATGLPVSMATAADNAAYSNTANGWSYAIVSVTNANGVATNYRVYRSQYSFSGTFSMRVS